MRDYTLSSEKIAELERLHRNLRDKRQADRVKAVLALSKGWSPAQVAEILLFDEKTSRHYFERYQQGGAEALLADHYHGAIAKLTDHQMQALDGYLQDHLFTDAKEVVAYIATTYHVSYSVGGVTDLLHRLGFSYKKPSHVPGKQDPALQQAFVEEYEHLKATKGKNDPVYFADATHPQHNSIPSYGWIKKETDKALPANCGRLRLNINGAIDIETLEPVSGFYETINAQAALDLFKIEAKHPDANRIYVIIDNARYYRSRWLKQKLKGRRSN